MPESVSSPTSLILTDLISILVQLDGLMGIVTMLRTGSK